MSLNAAHEGYEYQDLLTVYYILQDILNNNHSKYIIDRKEFDEDKVDDLTIVNANGTFKKQIKYSNYTNRHILEKKNLSQAAGYQLALDILFRSWEAHPQRFTTEIRLCLAWNEPIDELLNILKPSTNNSSFENNSTKLFHIDVDKLWPITSDPLDSWRRFKKESSTICRSLFSNFCDQMIIELDFPKFSLDIKNPGSLETIVLKLTNELGIGVYPNKHETVESFILGLLHYIKKSRSLGSSLTTKEIFSRFQIQTTYGAIEQSFPIDYTKNISLERFTSCIIEKLQVENKIILKGAPGSGKSWALESIISELKNQNIKVIKHYCYTDLNDEFQKERITLNVFYGNLISDILVAFPELKSSKEQLYASNITELNILLSNITSNTVLIVDGLDHIERIFEYREWTDLAKTDIAIIEAINKLTVSPFVKILVTSQPIEELKYIENYYQVEIPSWGTSEIKTILNKFIIEDVKLNGENYLSDLLLEKSEGNPLYLTYILNEIQINSSDISNIIESLPIYSYNLSNYYQYMLSKLDTRLKVPQILSGVNFSLSNIELKEITGEGDYVDEVLFHISPLIKQNFSQNGYIIYHESFRRYILDELKQKNILLDKVEW